MNEKVGESQGHASEHRSTREIPQDELKKILEAHRKWVESEGKERERANLVDANLQKATLFKANLQKADLFKANLQGAGLWRASLQGANLRGANLQKATLFKANLQMADLGGANLQEADLSDANLQGADLWRANLQKATLFKANLQGAYLREAEGLTASQVKTARNWELAFYGDDFLNELGLPPDHNERVKKKLAEREKEKKATDAQ